MSKQPHIEEVKWSTIRDEVALIDSKLATIIDLTKPSNKHTFIKARYPFGAKILHEGKLHLPTEAGKVVSIDHSEVPENFRKKLDYRFVPMGLIISKSVEVFFETDERVMPARFYGVGSIFGLWQLFDPTPSNMVKKIWNLSAGARSVFMLPMISDSASHTRLKRDYGISSYQPKTLRDHRELFVDINNHSKNVDPWTCDVLFFTNEWITESDDDLTLLRLHKYWLSEAWDQSYHCRNYMTFDAARENFAKEVSKRHLKPKPHILSTIKHLMTIGEGIFPGFVPACNSEEAAPVHAIQDAYVNSYLLKQQAPILMHPYNLSKNGAYQSAYYSLALATLLDSAPNPKASSCIMADLRELKMLMDVMMNYYSESPASYEFFHAEEDRFGDISNTINMPKYDEKLLIYPPQYGERKFPHNSAFLRGCVRISLK